jgi:DNA invertase Pin-like site-specific DNA recombinase
MLTVLGGVAQLEREMMLERQREGIAKAKSAGKYKGRKPIALERSKMLYGSQRTLQAKSSPVGCLILRGDSTLNYEKTLNLTKNPQSVNLFSLRINQWSGEIRHASRRRPWRFANTSRS